MTKKREIRRKYENFEEFYGFKAKILHNFVKLTCFKRILRCKVSFSQKKFAFANMKFLIVKYKCANLNTNHGCNFLKIKFG